MTELSGTSGNEERRRRMAKHVVVLVTAPSKDVGREIGQTLLERSLAACINLVPAVESLYVWQGEVCDDEEVLLVIKTTAAAFDALVTAVRNVHPYDVPEIIALPIAAGFQDYLDWISESTDA